MADQTPEEVAEGQNKPSSSYVQRDAGGNVLRPDNTPKYDEGEDWQIDPLHSSQYDYETDPRRKTAATIANEQNKPSSSYVQRDAAGNAVQPDKPAVEAKTYDYQKEKHYDYQNEEHYDYQRERQKPVKLPNENAAKEPYSTSQGYDYQKDSNNPHFNWNRKSSPNLGKKLSDYIVKAAIHYANITPTYTIGKVLGANDDGTYSTTRVNGIQMDIALADPFMDPQTGDSVLLVSTDNDPHSNLILGYGWRSGAPNV